MIDCIGCLLPKDHWETPKEDNCLILEEREKGKKGTKGKVIMKIKIQTPPKDWLKIKISEDKVHPAMMGNNKKGVTQSCDYLVLVPQNNYIDAYFIEMKKPLCPDGSDVRTKACEQILHTVPVWDYLVSMTETHFQKKINITINKHFAIIAGSTTPKESEITYKPRVRPVTEESFEYNKEKFRLFRSSSKIPAIENLKYN